MQYTLKPVKKHKLENEQNLKEGEQDHGMLNLERSNIMHIVEAMAEHRKQIISLVLIILARFESKQECH